MGPHFYGGESIPAKMSLEDSFLPVIFDQKMSDFENRSFLGVIFAPKGVKTTRSRDIMDSAKSVLKGHFWRQMG